MSKEKESDYSAEDDTKAVEEFAEAAQSEFRKLVEKLKEEEKAKDESNNVLGNS
jgi:hypothetical protein